MKIQVGDSINHTYTVKQKDLAEFETGLVHSVCSTFALGREIEWTTRKFVLRIVSNTEEWVGSYLEIKHIAPALINEQLSFEAEVIKYDGEELIANVEVSVGERMIAKARTGQKKVDKEKFKENLSRLARNGEG